MEKTRDGMLFTFQTHSLLFSPSLLRICVSLFYSTYPASSSTPDLPSKERKFVGKSSEKCFKWTLEVIVTVIRIWIQLLDWD